MRKSLGAAALVVAAGLVTVALPSAPVAAAERAVAATTGAEWSTQNRPRTRIEVRPRGRPLYRQCVDVFRETYRPYWGGLVLSDHMRCWWVRG